MDIVVLSDIIEIMTKGCEKSSLCINIGVYRPPFPLCTHYPVTYILLYIMYLLKQIPLVMLCLSSLESVSRIIYK